MEKHQYMGIGGLIVGIMSYMVGSSICGTTYGWRVLLVSLLVCPFLATVWVIIQTYVDAI